MGPPLAPLRDAPAAGANQDTEAKVAPEDPAARRAAVAAMAAVRALRDGCLCGACEGKGHIVRRTRVGTRPVGGGLRVPIFANIEGPCGRCDGGGCASLERVRQLAAAAVTRLLLVPETSGLRADVLVTARRALDELLQAAAAPLARLTEDAARDALIRVRTAPVELLLVLPPAKASGSSASKGGAEGASRSAAGRRLVTIDGVRLRVVGPHGAERVDGAWTALLGRLRLDDVGNDGDGPDRQPQEAADLVLEVLVLTTRVDPPAPKASDSPGSESGSKSRSRRNSRSKPNSAGGAEP